ncbi:putative F-box protein [Citrus sinensis]|uniref:F-box protein n=1 Tax=Citrus sinensis TaxID=2711 RepID=A0ACB8L908_CITSI|nr:putative F-box protein [Citrus sinensis]
MGFLGNSYQSYPTREEAEEAFQEFRRAEEIMLQNPTVQLQHHHHQHPRKLHPNYTSFTSLNVHRRHFTVLARSYQMLVSRGNVRKSRSYGRVRTGQHTNRISALPNSLLCHILAYLPTKYAMATSILSRRWKHVWTSLNNLSFDDRLCSRHPAFPEVGTQGFVDFVQTVLLRTDPGNIDRFSLHWSTPTNLSYLNHWMSSAVNRHVRELELDLGENNRIQLPDMLYTSTTLEVLKLHSDYMINVPTDGPCFPVVKVLHMMLHNPENALTEKMFSICPSLEDLSIHAYLYEDGPQTNFIIESSTLKRFTFRVTLQDNYFSEIEHSVMLKAPNLQYLYIASDILGSYVLHDLHSVNKVVLDIFYGEWTNGDPNCVVQLLAGLNKTKFLSVNAGITYIMLLTGPSAYVTVAQNALFMQYDFFGCDAYRKWVASSACNPQCLSQFGESIGTQEEIITNNATIKCTDLVPLTATGKVEGEKVLGKIETPFEKTKLAAYTLSAISPCMRLFEVIAKEIQALLNPDDGNASVCHHINSRILLLSQRIRKIMSSSSDSDREGDEWYEIVDVPDDAMYLDSEDGWADDKGDTVIEINGDRGPTIWKFTSRWLHTWPREDR